MRILLVEPWLAGSHLQWADGYRRASRHQLDVVGLPGRAWRWRLRGGALPLAARIEAWVADHGRPDLLLVSGMVDVAHLLGLTRRVLAPEQPVVIYQHESQLVHPSPPGRDEQEAALRNWLSWCAADLVLFNSRYHRDAVTAALPGFLAALPDRSHLPALAAVTARFEVLPLGVDLSWTGGPTAPARATTAPTATSRWGDGGDPVILWPHRWEADKNPDVFAAALARADQAGAGFRLVLAGEDAEGGTSREMTSREMTSREMTSREMTSREMMAERWAHRVVASGPFETDRYRELVGRCDLVVSCARHEFFGAAVVEAVAAGCVPVLPPALAYPDVIPERWHRAVLHRHGRFGSSLVEALTTLGERRAATTGLAAAVVDRYDWTVLGPRYDDRLEAQLVARPAAGRPAETGSGNLALGP